MVARPFKFDVPQLSFLLAEFRNAVRAYAELGDHSSLIFFALWQVYDASLGSRSLSHRKMIPDFSHCCPNRYKGTVEYRGNKCGFHAPKSAGALSEPYAIKST